MERCLRMTMRCRRSGMRWPPWSAFVSAKVSGETIPLGPHALGQRIASAGGIPYQRPYEASAMGGGVWQDNYDGTFTQLDDTTTSRLPVGPISTSTSWG